MNEVQTIDTLGKTRPILKDIEKYSGQAKANFDFLQNAFEQDQSEIILNSITRCDVKALSGLTNDALIEQFFHNWSVGKHGNYKTSLMTLNELKKELTKRQSSFKPSDIQFIRRLIASTYLQCQNYSKAISEYSELYQLTTQEELRNACSLDIAICFYLNRDTHKAQEWCHKILNTNPANQRIKIHATLLSIQLKLFVTTDVVEIEKLEKTVDELESQIFYSSNKVLILKYTFIKYQIASLRDNQKESILILRNLFNHCIESVYIDRAKKILYTLYKQFPEEIKEHEKILLVDEILRSEDPDKCLYFHNGKAKVQSYSTVFYNHIFVVDLNSGLFIKNSEVNVFTEIQLRTIKAIIMSGHLGIKHKALAEAVYLEEFWEIKNGEERIRKIIQKLKSFGLNITCKDNKYFFNFENFHVILQRNSQPSHLTNYLKKELPVTFHRRDIENKLGLKKVMSLNYINDWMEQGKIQAFNRGKSQRYTIL